MCLTFESWFKIHGLFQAYLQFFLIMILACMLIHDFICRCMKSCWSKHYGGFASRKKKCCQNKLNWKIYIIKLWPLKNSGLMWSAVCTYMRFCSSNRCTYMHVSVCVLFACLGSDPDQSMFNQWRPDGVCVCAQPLIVHFSVFKTLCIYVSVCITVGEM